MSNPGAALSQAADVLDAFDAVAHCDECPRRIALVKFHMKDLRQVVRKRAHGARTTHTWDELTERTTAELAGNVAFALEHLDQPHEPAAPKVEREFKTKTEDERPTCPDCGTHVNVTGNRIRAHKASSGNTCRRRVMEPLRIVAPPINLPAPPRLASLKHVAPKADERRSRLDAGSECRECGKWLPGERQLCGACYVAATHRPPA